MKTITFLVLLNFQAGHEYAGRVEAQELAKLVAEEKKEQ